MTRAYVGLGANLGDREATLRRAVELLAGVEGVEVVAVSELRETEPVGVVDQPAFLNGAIAVETSLSPRELLDSLLHVELQLGRVRDGTRWGPRTVDLDLLVYGDDVVDEPGLRVPHPASTNAGSLSTRSRSSIRRSSSPARARFRRY